MAWVEKRGDMWRVRFRNPDGSVATDSTHPTKTVATTRAIAIETDQQRDTFINPEHGKITLATWVEEWLDAHDVAESTFERYRSHLDIHILPRFGDTPLNGITRMAVKRWVKDLNHTRARSTVASILSLLSMILGKAVEERRIPMNPCRRLRNTAPHRPERPSPPQPQDPAHRRRRPRSRPSQRLGHRLPGIRGIYSHVSPAVEQRLVDGLQARWEQHAPQPGPAKGDNTSN